MATATEFAVELEDRPGTLAELLELLGNAGVNVEGFGGAAVGSKAMLQFITDNPERATSVLDTAGRAYSKREVLLLTIANQPGAGARVARAFADEGINITGGYVTFSGQVAFATDNQTKAAEVAGRLGVL
jgi:hypothetical protein